MFWIARLEAENSNHWMQVHIQDCTREEAERLAQRQNLKFAEDYDRPLYTLVSLERVKNGS